MGQTVLTANNVKIMNLIRQDADSIYKDRIPVATQENVAEIGQSILSTGYEPQLNQFINTLVNRIGFTFIQRRGVWQNKLKFANKGMIPFGTDVQEIFVDMAKAKEFNPTTAETEVFKRETPNVLVAYHRQDRQNMYKVTITRQQLKQAFVNEMGLSDLLTQLSVSLVRGDEYDTYLLSKQLIANYYEKGLFYPVVVENPMESQENAKAFVESIRGTSNLLEFNSTQFNAQGVNTYTLKENQIILINPLTEAKIDVEVLAYAFNMSKADIQTRMVVVDSLGGTGMENVYAVVVDKDWFMIWDTVYESGSIYNPDGLYWNNTLHHWQILSTSQFCNAVVFMAKPTVTGVTVTPSAVTVAKGNTQQLSAKVTGDTSNSVVWSVASATSANTVINSQGLLMIGSDETASKLTVTATSYFDETQSGTSTVTVQA